MRTLIFRSRRALTRFSVGLVFLAGVLAMPALAQETDAAPEQPEQPQIDLSVDGSPVEIDGEVLFVSFGLTALPSEERAALIAERILQVAASSDEGTVVMQIRAGEFGLRIFADGTEISTVTDFDAEIEGADKDLIAALQANAIEQAIIGYRGERSDTGRVQSVFTVLILTAVFLAFSFGLFWIRRHFSNWVQNRISGGLEGIEQASNEIVRSETVAVAAAALVRLVLLGLFLVLLYYYLSVVLHSFAETRPIAEDLLRLLTDPIYSIVTAALTQIPNFVALLVIVVITRFAVRTTRMFFLNIDSGAIKIGGFEHQWVWPTFNITRALIILLAVIFAFPYIPGSGSDAFKGVSILIGVMMSFGSSSVVGNLLAGVFVIYKRSTNIGDRIKVGEHTGDVVAIKLMETHLKSIKNELISVPNSLLLSTDVVNYTSQLDDRGLLVHTTVGIGYEEPQKKIEAMLITAAGRTRHLKKTPKPFVLRIALADYSVQYQINAYTSQGSRLPQILSDLHSNILDVFNEEKVQIMTPSYIADTDQPKIAPV